MCYTNNYIFHSAQKGGAALHPSRSLRDFFKKGDVLLLGLCLLASTVGLVLIYSATRYDPDLPEYVQKQAMFSCLGVVA